MSQHKSAGICGITLQWRHNDHDGVSNHQPPSCLLKRLFRRWSKKTSKLRVTGLCVGNSPGPVNSRHKGLATRKMSPFDDVIMSLQTVPFRQFKNKHIHTLNTHKHRRIYKCTRVFCRNHCIRKVSYLSILRNAVAKDVVNFDPSGSSP